LKGWEKFVGGEKKRGRKSPKTHAPKGPKVSGGKLHRPGGGVKRWGKTRRTREETQGDKGDQK